MSNIVSKLIETTSESPISRKLAACLLRGCNKPIGPIHVNHDRNYFHGKVCASAHAEGSAILAHYGVNLMYNPKFGWDLKRKAIY